MEQGSSRRGILCDAAPAYESARICAANNPHIAILAVFNTVDKNLQL